MFNWKYQHKTDEEKVAEREKKVLEEQTREEKPESFASKNVKTITFIVMLALFFVFLGPISVFTIHEKIVEARESKKPEITSSDLLELSQLGSEITIEDVRQFKGTESEDDEKISYIIFTDEFIFYAEQAKDSPVLTDTYLRSRTRGKGNEIEIDIRTDRVVDFFATN